MAANRFLPSDRLRVATSCTAKLPDPEQASAYSEMSALRDALDCELIVPFSQCSHGAEVSSEFKLIADEGEFIYGSWEVQTADIAHFKRTQRKRVDTMFAALSEATQISVVDLEQRWEVRGGFSYARRMQALGVRFLYTWYNYDQSLCAYIASALLGIPRAVSLCEGFEHEDYDLKVPELHLRTADLVIATNEVAEKVARSLVSDFGERLVQGTGPEFVSSIADRIHALIAKESGGPYGLQAAFHESTDRGDEGSGSGGLRYVVVCAERTGSNLLLEVLGLDLGNELFNPDYLSDCFIPISVPELRRDPELLKLRQSDPAAFLDRYWKIGEDLGLSASGFKLMYFHAAEQQAVVDYLLNSEGIRVIHVTRRNRLKRFLSMRRAEVSGSWYKTQKNKGSGIPDSATELNVDDMLADFAYQAVEEQKFSALFRGPRLIELCYEEYAKDLEGTRDRVAEFLGVKLPKPFLRSRRTGTKSLRDSIANFDAVAAALQGSGLGSYLG